MNGTVPRPSFEGTPEAVRAIMRGNRRVDTRPEVALRSALHGLGYRFRKDHVIREQGLRINADIVFTRARLAVFVDGCFWHGCPEHGRIPSKNEAYWAAKLGRNAERDRRNTAALEAAGWRVVRSWEHEPADRTVERIRALLAGNVEP